MRVVTRTSSWPSETTAAVSRTSSSTSTASNAYGNVPASMREVSSTSPTRSARREVSLSIRPRKDSRCSCVSSRQLLWNLLTNAVKYTVTGDEVEVAAANEDGVVAVSVRDHGPGIPVESQRLIFEKFGRVSQDGGSKPGAGLGLFIARSIAEAHGGTLDVESEAGSGATFTVRLPLPSA